jgi:molecular chaperone GrpE (heat shock protein)
MADDRGEQNPEAAGQEPAEDTPAPAANNLLEQLRSDLEAAQDRLLRSHAELDNYRKRAAR